MARIIGTEKSPYYEKHVEIYSKNKVGQYAKYLQRNPIFVEYYQINQALSRADTGLQSITTLVGSQSPIRYNKISDFPIFNMTDLKPDALYDETGGFDIEMDINGLVILPNTLKPIPGDFIYLKLPGMQQAALLKVNNFEYNTIQSNDYYLLDTHLTYMGDKNNFEKYDQINKQVVESYTCVFDNIGTQDNCFIKNDDLKIAEQIKDFIRQLADAYRSIFYQSDVGAFACFGYWTTTPTYLYDLYLTRFLKETDLFFDDTGNHSTGLTYDDLLPPNFDFLYQQTIWYAVQHRTALKLKPYQYYRTASISKSGSPFKYSTDAQNTQSIQLLLQKCPIDEQLDQRVLGFTPEYFPILLTKGIQSKNLESTDYMDQIIYNWILNIDEPVDINKLLDYDLTMSRHNYWYIPVILYILKQRYNDIFAISQS